MPKHYLFQMEINKKCLNKFEPRRICDPSNRLIFWRCTAAYFLNQKRHEMKKDQNNVYKHRQKERQSRMKRGRAENRKPNRETEKTNLRRQLSRPLTKVMNEKKKQRNLGKKVLRNPN